MRAWILVTEVPAVHNIVAYIILALNVIIPGSGTCLSVCMAERYLNNKTQLFVGVFQLLTAIYLFGWIWSIYWGILIIQNSQGGHRELKKLMGNNPNENNNANLQGQAPGSR